MKQIYRFGDKGYIHMDSYPENHETHPVNFKTFLLSLVVAAIASMTAAAMVGVDITDPKTWSNQNAHRSYR